MGFLRISRCASECNETNIERRIERSCNKPDTLRCHGSLVNGSASALPDLGDATVVLGSLIDLGGVARGKSVPAGRIEAFRRSGMGASPTWNVFCIDDHIAFTPTLGVAGDLRLRLDVDALRHVDEGTAWAPAQLFDQSGEPSPLDTRGLLARIVRDAATEQLEALVGCEIEFTLFAADGTELASEPWAAYGLGALLEPSRNALARDLVATAADAGLGLEQLHAEYGRNQYEISLPPADPVAAADAVVLARLLIGRAAARHGFRASFSPMPSAESNAGNGAHQHLSVTRDGVPLLSGGDGPHGLTAEGASALAGVLGHLPDLLGFYAGSLLSGTRLQPGHWSGAHRCWGLENREAAVRLCAATPGNPHGASIELKPVDATANPYLAIAAMLWSAVDGIRSPASLPAEVVGDPSAEGVPVLETDQRLVLETLAGSAAALRFAGPDLHAAHLAVRRHEVDAFRDTPLDRLAERFRFTWSI
jgi:glutamine synthetase